MFKYVIFFVVFTVGSLFGMKEGDIEICNDSSDVNLESVLAECNQKLNELGDGYKTIKDSYGDMILNIKWCYDYIELQDCYMAHYNMQFIDKNIELVKNNNIVGEKVNHNLLRFIEDISKRLNNLNERFKDKYDLKSIRAKLDNLLSAPDELTLNKRSLKLNNILFNNFCDKSRIVFNNIVACKECLLNKNPQAKDILNEIRCLDEQYQTIEEGLKKIFNRCTKKLKALVKEFNSDSSDKEESSNESNESDIEICNDSSGFNLESELAKCKQKLNELGDGDKTIKDSYGEIILDIEECNKYIKSRDCCTASLKMRLINKNIELLKNDNSSYEFFNQKVLKSIGDISRRVNKLNESFKKKYDFSTIGEKLDNLLSAPDKLTLNKRSLKLNNILFNNFSPESKGVFDYIVQCKECLLNKNPQANEKLKLVLYLLNNIEIEKIEKFFKDKFQKIYVKLKALIEKEFNSDSRDIAKFIFNKFQKIDEVISALIEKDVKSDCIDKEESSNGSNESDIEICNDSSGFNLESELAECKQKLNELGDGDKPIKDSYGEIILDIEECNKYIKSRDCCTASLKMRLINKNIELLKNDNSSYEFFNQKVLKSIGDISRRVNKLNESFKKKYDFSTIGEKLDKFLSITDISTLKKRKTKLSNLLFNNYDKQNNSIFLCISECKKLILEKNIRAKNELNSINTYIAISKLNEDFKKKFQDMSEVLSALIEKESSLVSIDKKSNSNELNSDENKPNLGGIDNELNTEKSSDCSIFDSKGNERNFEESSIVNELNSNDKKSNSKEPSGDTIEFESRSNNHFINLKSLLKIFQDKIITLGKEDTQIIKELYEDILTDIQWANGMINLKNSWQAKAEIEKISKKMKNIKEEPDNKIDKSFQTDLLMIIDCMNNYFNELNLYYKKSFDLSSINAKLDELLSEDDLEALNTKESILKSILFSYYDSAHHDNILSVITECKHYLLKKNSLCRMLLKKIESEIQSNDKLEKDFKKKFQEMYEKLKDWVEKEFNLVSIDKKSNSNELSSDEKKSNSNEFNDVLIENKPDLSGIDNEPNFNELNSDENKPNLGGIDNELNGDDSIDKEQNSDEKEFNSKEFISDVSSEKKSNFNELNSDENKPNLGGIDKEQNSDEKEFNSKEFISDVSSEKKSNFNEQNSDESNDVLIENKTDLRGVDNELNSKNIYEKLDELLFATDISTLNTIHQKLNDIFLNNFSEESKVVFDYIVECKECLLNKNPQANEKLSSISIFIEDGSIEENLKEKFQEMYEKLKDWVEKEFNLVSIDKEESSNENKSNSKESKNVLIENKPNLSGIVNELNSDENKPNLGGIDNELNTEESSDDPIDENTSNSSGIDNEQNSNEKKSNLDTSDKGFRNQEIFDLVTRTFHQNKLNSNKQNSNELSSDENKPNLGGIDNEQSSNEQNSKKSNYDSIKLLFSFLTLQDPMFGVLYSIFCLAQHLIPSKTDNISKDFIQIKQTESKLGNPLSTLLKFVISFGITKYACYKGLMQQQLWILKLYHQYKQWQKTVVKHKFPRIANKFISYI